MELLDKIGKKATKTYKITAEKTSKLAKETKLKIAMSMNKSNISDLYEEIGKKVYEKYIREEKPEIKEELLELCTQIDALASEIEEARLEILQLKDRKQCFQCFYEMDIDAHFCPNCGVKQTEEEKRKVNQKEQNEVQQGEVLKEEREEKLEQEEIKKEEKEFIEKSQEELIEEKQDEELEKEIDLEEDETI